MKRFIFAMMLALLSISPPGGAADAAGKNACPTSAWTQGCFDHTASSRRVKPQYLKRIKFERSGFAVLRLEPYEVVAVNKRGEVVVPGIVSGNYDFRDAPEGIAEFSIPAKNATSDFNEFNCGYFRISDFKIIIAPVYNRCGTFNQGKALVCTNCRPDCVECNHEAFYGGEGLVVNAKNEILERVELPKLPSCSTVAGVGGYPKDQPCRPSDGMTGN